MPNLLEWTFKMNDQISTPAKSAAGGLSAFVGVAHNALAVLDYAAQSAMALGNALVAGIQPAIQREKTLGSFEVMLGSATDAVNTYAEAVKFANETPFETQDVVSSYKQLLAAQFDRKDLQTVVRIVGDASSLQEFPAQAMESVNRALGQIKSKGKLSQEELNQVAEAVPLNQSKFLANLSTLYGMTEEQTRKLKDQGKIDAESGVFAILQTLQQQFGGGMEKASKQVAGLWSTIESMPTTYLEKLQDTKGYESLRGALQGVVNVLDPASERGEQFGTFLNALGSGALEGASLAIEYLTQGVAAFADGLMTALGPLNTAFGPANQDNLNNFKTAMELTGAAIGTTAGFVSDLATALGWVYDKFSAIGQWIASNETASSIIMGAGGQLAESYLASQNTTGATGTSTQDVLRAQARLQRREAGRDALTAISADIPYMAEGGYVDSPTVAMIGEAGPEVVVPLHKFADIVSESGGSGGGDTYVFSPTTHVNVEGGGSGGGNDLSAFELSKVVQAEIIQALERFAIQSGRRRMA